MTAGPERCRLETLGVLAARGPDARNFLQGQLSQDLRRVTPQFTPLAAFHSPQGRTIAIMRFVDAGSADILCVTRRELIDPLLQRLRRYVLRSKVTLADESDRWTCWGLGRCEALPDTAPPGTSTRLGEGAAWRHALPSGRAIALLPAQAPPPAGEERSGPEAWELADVEDGLPELVAGTSETFVAQMLNLDTLQGIAFDKGCYAGQEVIARAHYRGRVKRRMQRFALPLDHEAPEAGAQISLADGRSARVVRVARDASAARWQLLAVTAFGNAAGESPDADAAAGPAPVAAAALDLQQLPLPYPLEPGPGA